MTTATNTYIDVLEELLTHELLPSQINACKLTIMLLKYLSEMDYYIQDLVEDLEGMVPPDAHSELLSVFSQKDIMNHTSDITVQIQGRMDQPKVFAQEIQKFLESHKDVFDGRGTAQIQIQQPLVRH